MHLHAYLEARSQGKRIDRAEIGSAYDRLRRDYRAQVELPPFAGEVELTHRGDEALAVLTERVVRASSALIGAVSSCFSVALGLSTVKRLVTALGGEVGIESEVGVGSCVWFELPIAHAGSPSEPLRIVSRR